jgi:N-acetylmuramoyl-L-alanine amidase
MRPVNEIILHCTATPEGRPVSVDTIRKWHRDRGWADIGYHYVVHLDGRIESGRPVEQVGAHVANRNARTIGVVYVGGTDKNGKPKDTRTPAQKAALVKLLRDLLLRFPTIRAISGHNEYANKACPCFNARQEYAGLTSEVKPVAFIPEVETSDDDAEPAPAEKPWWEKSPIARQAVNTASALGITGATIFGLDWRVVVALAVLVAGVSIYALRVQSANRAKVA